MGAGMHACHVRLLRNPYTPGFIWRNVRRSESARLRTCLAMLSAIPQRNVSVSCTGGESTALRKPTLRSLLLRPDIFFLWSSWFHLHITSSSSSSCVVCFRTCPRDVWCVRSLVFGSTLLFLFHSVCSLSPECCVEEEAQF